MFTRYVLPVIGALTLAFAVTQMLKAQQKPEAGSPAVEPGKSPYLKQLAGAGLVEPETENILIGANVPGVAEAVYVRVGDVVRPGDPLFQIDDRSLRSEVRVRESLLASAQASLDKLNLTPRPEERPTNEAKVAEAEVTLRDQTQLYERMRRLGNSAAEEELVRRQLAVELGKTQLIRARADFKLWEAGAWGPDKQIAQAAVDQAKAQLEQTKTELARLTMNAPHFRWKKDATGVDPTKEAAVRYWVLQVNIRPGEYVGNSPGQPLVILGFVGRTHVRVDIDENDIARFRPTMTGVAKPRGNPDVSFPLAFVRVEPYVIPKKSLTGANTERVDTRVLQVIYALDQKDSTLYVGQQMDVFLDAGGR